MTAETEPVTPEDEPMAPEGKTTETDMTGGTDATAEQASAPAAEKTAAPAAEQATEAKSAKASAKAAPAAEKDSAPAGEHATEAKAAKPSAKSEPAPRRGHHAGNWTGLRARYRDEVVPVLQKEFNYTNPMQVPQLTKIVVNIGLGEALTNAKALDAAVGDLAQITGQKPIVTRARRSIAQFRVRTGNPIGAKVTLRGQHMWDFLERLTRLALPRIRDFRGVPSKSFDGRGNYSLGMREQLAFPEIDYDKIDRLRGLEVSIVTTAQTDEESKRLLQLLGMPFAG